MWMPEYKDSFEINHEEALEILKGVLTLCDKELEPISKNTLVVHMRSGDIFSNCPHPKYIPPPLSFYKNILNERVKDYKKKFSQKEPPRPEFWGGFSIEVNYWEFWQGRRNRTHDRFCYTQSKSGWDIERMSP